MDQEATKFSIAVSDTVVVYNQVAITEVSK
jgi:hypothetical protein